MSFRLEYPLVSGRLLVDGNDFYVGNSSSNLSQLALKTDIPTVSQYVHPSTKQCSWNPDLSNYYTKSEVDDKVNSGFHLIYNNTIPFNINGSDVGYTLIDSDVVNSWFDYGILYVDASMTVTSVEAGPYAVGEALFIRAGTDPHRSRGECILTTDDVTELGSSDYPLTVRSTELCLKQNNLIKSLLGTENYQISKNKPIQVMASYFFEYEDNTTASGSFSLKVYVM